MKIAISRPTADLEEAKTLFASACEHGFTGVQMKANQYQDLTSPPERFREYYGDLADMARGGIIAYPGNDIREWAGIVQPVLRFAQVVRAEPVCICAGVDRSDTSDERFRAVAEMLNTLGRKAADAGLRLSLHNHADSLFESEGDLERLFRYVDAAMCGLTLDTAHAARSGMTDVAEVAERFRSVLANVHLKDLARDGSFCPLGTGTLDLASILERLKSSGYNEWLVVDEESKGISTEEACRVSAEFLRANGILY